MLIQDTRDGRPRSPEITTRAEFIHDEFQLAYYDIGDQIMFLKEYVGKEAAFVDEEIAILQDVLIDMAERCQSKQEPALGLRMRMESILLPLHVYGESIAAMDISPRKAKGLKERYFQPIFPQLSALGTTLVEVHREQTSYSEEAIAFSGLAHEICFHQLMHLFGSCKTFTAPTGYIQDRFIKRSARVDATVFIHASKSEPTIRNVQIKARQDQGDETPGILYVYGKEDMKNYFSDAEWRGVGVQGVFPALQAMSSPEHIANPDVLLRLQRIRQGILNKTLADTTQIAA